MKTHLTAFQHIYPHLFGLYLGALILLTVLPTNGMNEDLLNAHYVLRIRYDYLLHGLAWMPLPVLLFISLRSRLKDTRLWKIFLIALILAMILEFAQLLLPYRTFNVNDLAGNATGVLTGYLLLAVFSNRSLKFNPKNPQS